MDNTFASISPPHVRVDTTSPHTHTKKKKKKKNSIKDKISLLMVNERLQVGIII